MNRKNIFKVIALILISATLFLTASCSSDGKAGVNAEYEILGMDYQTYKKEYAIKMYKTTSETVLNALFAKEAEGVTYYYGSGSALVGVKDGKIVYYGYLTSAVYAATSFPTVKGVLEFEGLAGVWDAIPEITETDSNIPFACWEISNGYAAVSSVGGADISEIGNNMASAFVVFSDKSLCSIYD